jgi:uncharacterized protein
LRAIAGRALVEDVALGLVLVHIAVDAFVAVEPGVHRSDHLAAAFVPGGIVLAAIWLKAGLRPGLRAAVDIVVGALALVGGGLAVSHAAASGPAGDDWTGMLLVPAGLALLAVGGGLLWTSRKRHGHWLLRRLLLSVVAVIVAYSFVLPVGMAIVATHRPRKPVQPVSFQRPSQPVRVRTSDGLTLMGLYVPSRNGAAVITYPREWTAGQARLLAAHGFGVLMLDMRGHGASDGDPDAFGWGATKDLDAAVAWLRERSDVREGRVGGIGLSVGGEQLLEAAAGNQGLQAVVSEGAGERSVRETALYGLRGLPSLPAAAVQTAALAVFSGKTPPPNLRDLVGAIAPRPVLLIYAGQGAGGEELQPQYAAAGRSVTLWKIARAGHTGGLAAAPSEYGKRVVTFFDDALLGVK